MSYFHGKNLEIFTQVLHEELLAHWSLVATLERRRFEGKKPRISIEQVKSLPHKVAVKEADR